MKFKIVCKICKEYIWVRGVSESDTNATVLNEGDDAWNDACEHIQFGGDYDIVDEEMIDFDE